MNDSTYDAYSLYRYVKEINHNLDSFTHDKIHLPVTLQAEQQLKIYNIFDAIYSLESPPEVQSLKIQLEDILEGACRQQYDVESFLRSASIDDLDKILSEVRQGDFLFIEDQVAVPPAWSACLEKIKVAMKSEYFSQYAKDKGYESPQEYVTSCISQLIWDKSPIEVKADWVGTEVWSLLKQSNFYSISETKEDPIGTKEKPGYLSQAVS
ncbi:MAG: hypothetical protein JSS09_07950, partial [Verrucomicrobia bacterium]|nr:hypothetical protein [Verrucomicrobiota bacterium]